MTHAPNDDHAILSALDLLEGEDLAAWNAHRSGCAECRAAEDDARATAALLAFAVDPVEPPRDLRQRVLDRARPVSLHRARAPRPLLLVAAAVLLTLATAALTMRFIGGSDTGPSPREQQLIAENQALTDQIRDLSARIDALGSPETRQFSLQGLEAAPRSRARVFLDAERRQAVIFFSDLPRTAPDQELQLWMIPADTGVPEDAGTFEAGSDGTARLVLENLPVDREIKALAVTVEPRGGRPQPSGEMILLGEPGPSI